MDMNFLIVESTARITEWRNIPVVTSDAIEVFLHCGGDGVHKHKTGVKAQSDEHEEEEEGPELGNAMG